MKVPEKAKLGYMIDCRVSGKDYDGSIRISIEEYRVRFSVVVEAKPEVGQTTHACFVRLFCGAPNVGARSLKANWTVTAEFSGGGENNEYKALQRVCRNRTAPRPAKRGNETIEGDAAR
jgi:hypothetical protein